MNFIITNACNKGCPYCFAKEARKSLPLDEVDMTYGKFLELLEKVPPAKDGYEPNIKLLGGEPTQHPEFPRFVDEALRRGISVTIISNFLFKEDTRKFLVEKVNQYKRKVNFLVNATDLDKANRIERWKENYLAVYNALYAMDIESQISIGYTLEHNKDWKYYTDYTEFLMKHIKLVERLRLSLPFPGEAKDKEKFEFLGNKELGNKFLRIAKHAMNYGMVPSIDCIIYPCMFESKEHFKFLAKFSSQVRTACGESAPSDIFPDGSVSFCYPLKEAIKVDSAKYDNFGEVLKDMIMRYGTLETKVTLPEKCQTCGFLKSNICKGPCLGNFDLSGETIGRNM